MVESGRFSDREARWEMCCWTHLHLRPEPHRSRARIEECRRIIDSQDDEAIDHMRNSGY